MELVFCPADLLHLAEESRGIRSAVKPCDSMGFTPGSLPAIATYLGDRTRVAERIFKRSMLSLFLMIQTIFDKNHRSGG
jgi:hypothetical protein